MPWVLPVLYDFDTSVLTVPFHRQASHMLNACRWDRHGYHSIWLVYLHLWGGRFRLCFSFSQLKHGYHQLSRNTYNSLIRIRVSEGNSTHIERFSSEWGKANDIMKLERTHKTESYALPCSDTAVTLELATFYSTNPRIKDRALEEAPNTGSKALSVVQVCFSFATLIIS